MGWSVLHYLSSKVLVNYVSRFHPQNKFNQICNKGLGVGEKMI